jgi:hypothetical protein
MFTKTRTKTRLFTAILCCLLGVTLQGFMSQASAASATASAPVLNSAKVENGKYLLTWSLPPSESGTPAGGYDIVIDGKDTNNTWRITGTSQVITGLDTSADHSFIVEARWTQFKPHEFPRSNELTVKGMEAYPAPVLNSAKLEGGKYILSWTMPDNPNGAPAGGYDIFIDGTDTNATWRTTGTSQTISGLDNQKAHTFFLEARWTQASPSEFPRSQELNVAAAASDTSAPTVAITSPSSNTSVTSAKTMTIVAGASDNTGVSKVEFYDNGSLIGTDTTNTFSTDFPLTEAQNGVHTITAKAYDEAGNVS